VFRHLGTHLETMRLDLPLTHGGTEIRMALLGQVSAIPATGRARRSRAARRGALEIISQIASMSPGRKIG